MTERKQKVLATTYLYIDQRTSPNWDLVFGDSAAHDLLYFYKLEFISYILSISDWFIITFSVVKQDETWLAESLFQWNQHCWYQSKMKDIIELSSKSTNILLQSGEGRYLAPVFEIKSYWSVNTN